MDIYYINNTKIANELRKGRAVTGQPARISVGRRGTELECSYVLAMPEGTGDAMDWRYGMAIADAVYTICCQGEETFSLGQLLKILSGDPEQKLTRQKQEELEGLLERMTEIQLSLDCVDEMLSRGIINESQRLTWLCREPFLPLEKTKGRGYRCVNIPLLYRYAQTVGQVIAFPAELLGRGGEEKHLSNTREQILIKRYLIQQLEIMRNPRNAVNDRMIPYRRKSREWKDIGFFPELGIVREDYATEESWKQKKSKVHKAILRSLEYFVRIGYIEGYQVVRGMKKEIKGVEITGKIRNPGMLPEAPAQSE